MAIELTSPQWDELIEQYVQLQVDTMDMECLLTIATDFVTDYCEKLSDSELKQEIDNHDDELFEELVDNVTSKPDAALLTMNTDNLPDINDNEAEGITE